MLSREENDLLTRVGPGTPAEEMLRRYWHPIAFINELKKRPLRRRLLGEDLVVFRDDRGRLGLLALRCSHRGTSLEFGHLEDGGLRCCYHGWLYDVEGKILEMPGEPADSTFWQRLRHPAYQVQELGGVIFAYLGPEPAPLLPRYDVLVRDDGVRARRARTVNCNFFQMIENSVDQNHLKWLHRTAKTPTWDDGEINPQPFEYGILNTYTRHVAGKRYAHVNFFVLPTMNKTGNVEEGHPGEHEASSSGEVMRWRVPIDDTHTMHFTVEFGAIVDGKPVAKIMKDESERGYDYPLPSRERARVRAIRSIPPSPLSSPSKRRARRRLEDGRGCHGKKYFKAPCLEKLFSDAAASLECGLHAIRRRKPRPIDRRSQERA